MGESIVLLNSGIPFEIIAIGNELADAISVFT